MMKVVVFILSLLSMGTLIAHNQPTATVNHTVKLSGIPKGEGRFIRVDVTTNNQFKLGYYYCAAHDDVAYGLSYGYSVSNAPYQANHAIKFSICQDDSLTQCKEFAVDNFLTFRNAKGQLENDVTQVDIDVSDLKDAFQSCDPTPSPDMDDLVKQSIHANDRRFSSMG